MVAVVRHPLKGGGASRQLASSLVLGVAMLTMSVGSFAQDSPGQHPTALRELWGKEYAEAQRAAGAADRLRAAFEARYSWHPSSQLKPSSEEARQDAEEVLAAYALVIDSYPNTDIAAGSGIRLVGFYQYLGQTAQAIDKAKEIAEAYQNTTFAPKASFEVGLLYLQAANNPKQAIEWFQKVPRPKDGVIGPQDYDEKAKLYLAAQQQIARCALTMGRRDIARERFSHLAEQYPMYRDAIKREQDIQNKTALSADLRQVDEIIEQRISDLDATAAGTTAADGVTQMPWPKPSAPPAGTGVERTISHSDTGTSWEYRAGWCLLLLGIALSASGIVYRVRARQLKGDWR